MEKPIGFEILESRNTEREQQAQNSAGFEPLTMKFANSTADLQPLPLLTNSLTFATTTRRD